MLKKSLLLINLILISGCYEFIYFAEDPYSLVVDECNYVYDGGSQSESEDNPHPPLLTDGCREALESVLPFDENFDKKENKLLKEKAIEAFQVLVGYPLGFPPNYSILGVAPYSIPLTFHCILFPEDHPEACPDSTKQFSDFNINQNLFNYVVNQIKTITFSDEGESKNLVTIAMFHASFTKGTLTLFPSFGYRDNGYTLLSPFERAGTLIHEARHGDGYYHVACPEQPYEDETFTCDEELNSAMGIKIIFDEMLLHGSAPLVTKNNNSILSDWDIYLMAYRNCYTLKNRILNLPPELNELLDQTICHETDHHWLLDQEGISRNSKLFNGTALDYKNKTPRSVLDDLEFKPF